MLKSKIGAKTIGFLSNVSGEMTLPIAIFFSLAVVLTAVIAVPYLDETSREYAENKHFGIDNITTSSVGDNGKTKTYIVHRSIFDKGLQKICAADDQENC